MQKELQPFTAGKLAQWKYCKRAMLCNSSRRSGCIWRRSFDQHISEEEIHCYNVIDGEIVDLSSEQFEEPITSGFYQTGIPSDLSLRLSDPIKKKRYEALIRRMYKQ